jgi:hypothetical protein
MRRVVGVVVGGGGGCFLHPAVSGCFWQYSWGVIPLAHARHCAVIAMQHGRGSCGERPTVACGAAARRSAAQATRTLIFITFLLFYLSETLFSAGRKSAAKSSRAISEAKIE